jgi:transcriptional regulator with XRE-family HTH domain
MRSQKEIGRAIADLRAAAGKSQHQVAADAGVTRSTIANIEAGRQGISLDTLAPLSRSLGTTIAALLGEEPSGAVSASLIAQVAGQQRKITDTLAEACDLIVVLAEESERLGKILAEHGITATGSNSSEAREGQ